MNSIFLGNHDFPRLVSRFANDRKYRIEAAKLMSLMLLSMRGTPYVYQGDEIGMTNVAFHSFDDYRDIETLNLVKDETISGEEKNRLLAAVHRQGRDNARTPIQWSGEENGGFSNIQPWIKVNPNFREISIASQEKDPTSILNFYRKMIELRKKYPVLVYGSFEVHVLTHPKVFSYYRRDKEYTLLILLNFSSEELEFRLDRAYSNEDLLRGLSNYRATGKIQTVGQVTLKPWEATILKIK